MVALRARLTPRRCSRSRMPRRPPRDSLTVAVMLSLGFLFVTTTSFQSRYNSLTIDRPLRRAVSGRVAAIQMGTFVVGSLLGAIREPTDPAAIHCAINAESTRSRRSYPSHALKEARDGDLEGVVATQRTPKSATSVGKGRLRGNQSVERHIAPEFEPGFGADWGDEPDSGLGLRPSTPCVYTALTAASVGCARTAVYGSLLRAGSGR